MRYWEKRLVNNAIEYIVGGFRRERGPSADDHCRIYIESEKERIFVKVQAEGELTEKLGKDPVVVAEITNGQGIYTSIAQFPQLPMLITHDVEKVMEALGLKKR